MKLIKKLRARAGMTLTEILAAMLIMGLLTAGIAGMTPGAIGAWKGSVASSEASVLMSTAYHAIATELRYGENMKSNGKFDSALYGSDVKIENSKEEESGEKETSGYLMIGSQKLLSDRAYTTMKVVYKQEEPKDGLVSFKIKIKNGKTTLLVQDFTVRPLNGITVLEETE